MTYEQRELLLEHKFHSLLTLSQAETFAKEMNFEFERRDLVETDTYYDQFEEGIFLTKEGKLLVFLGGKDVNLFGIERRLFEIIEKNI